MKKPKRESAFAGIGMRAAIDALLTEVRALYLEDEIPWVVGYSGGKDSSATLQLVWLALAGIEPQARHKTVYVISTDTLVENPVVASWVNHSLDAMGLAARSTGLPIEPHRLVPALKDRFWVNMLGRGYPAPRHKFRWCTERLKINPSNQFIGDVVKKNGEVVLVLGTRKAESTRRAAVMNEAEKMRVRAGLSPNMSLPNSLVYSPIENWADDDVWLFLMQYKNPWGVRNKDLLTMYQGATADGECPLVVDTSTPSCGSSRFGCWVCTMVDQDRSMQAMIQNDEEKEWMTPLLELRDEIGQPDDRENRDFRRMSGRVQLYYDRPIPGPYTQEYRAYLLRRLLEIERRVRETGPDYVRDIELITMDELAEIRRIWLTDKHEVEDLLPGIYRDVRGESFPGVERDERVFGADEMAVLRDVCDGDDFQYQLMRELIDVEWSYRHHVRRAGLFDRLEKAIGKNFYTDEDDALIRARRRRDVLDIDHAGSPIPESETT